MNAKRNVVSNVHRGFAFLFGFVLLFLGMSSVNAQPYEAHAWTHGDWSSRVLYEARHALSKSNDGYSSNSDGSDIYQKWYGDWDYANDDATARDNAIEEGYGIVGPLGGLTAAIFAAVNVRILCVLFCIVLPLGIIAIIMQCIIIQIPFMGM